MKTYEASTDRFQTGLFLSNPAKCAYEPFPSSDHLFLTQKVVPAIRGELNDLISNAQIVIKICSFIITDPEIFQLLLSRAREGKVAIFLLTQLDNSKLINTSADMDISNADEQSMLHLSHIKRLYDHGVHVRAATTAHAKFVITDRNKGFLTSANLTSPSLELNMESGIYLNPEDSLQLDHLFDIIFQKGTQYRHYISASNQKKLIVQTGANVRQHDIGLLDRKSGIRFTYEAIIHDLYDEIVRIIDSAENFVHLASFSIVALENLPEFQEAIINAIHRKVTITVFCRGMNFREDHLEGCEWLRVAGCKIYGDFYNHSKGIANEHSGVLFTANIDGKHGLKGGFEVGCLLSENQRLTFVELQYYLIENSDYVFTANALREEFFETYSTYEQHRNIKCPQLPAALTIRNSANESLDFDTYPVFFASDKLGHLLVSGKNQWKCSYTDGVFEILKKEPKDKSRSVFLLKYVSLSIA
jgi:hypothetical protein